MPRDFLRLSAVGITLWLAIAATPAEAAILTVTTNADSGSTSLRGIVAASGDGDTITFDPALDGTTIGLTSGEIAINASVTIQGPGAINLTVSGTGASRIFEVAVGKTVSISGLALTKGAVVGSTDGDGIGGAILAHGSLTVTSCTFSENTATGGAGSSGFAHPGGAGDGGAIYVDAGADLHVDGCAFSFNVANGGTGGPDTAIAGDGGVGRGGAIFGDAGATVTVLDNSNLSKNGATGGTGGNGGSTGASGLGGEGLGGAIYVLGTLNLSLSQMVDNTAAGGTGGPGSDGSGGQGLGGAVATGGTASVQITTATINGNAASGGAAGGGPFKGGGSGGAIFNGGEADLTLTDSTLSGNQATDDCGNGGALYQFGSSASLVNDTFNGNSASCDGGALDVVLGLTLLNCTISGNTAPTGGGMSVTIEGGPVTLTNTIVAGNSGTTGPDGDVFIGTVQSGGHDVIGVAFTGGFASGPGDQIGSSGSPIDPGLNPLANNGGPTLTMALRLTSPALDHGDDAQAPPTDQTTITTRPQGAHSDVGAFELPTTTGTGGNSFTLTVIVTGEGHVTSAPTAGIDCPSSCSAAYFSGTTITLSRTPASGSVFAGWGGACSGLGPTATVTMNADETCTAAFAPATLVPTLGGPALALLAGLIAIGGGLLLRRS